MLPRQLVPSVTVLTLAALACAGLGPSAAPPQANPESAPATAELKPPPSTAVPTVEPTSSPSHTPMPTVPPEPLPEGPLQIEDDFSTDLGFWACELCDISGGHMTMGPYPVSGAYVQHVAYCAPCGMVTTYHMEVDVTFADGQSDRGFGIMARETEDYMFVYEITPWQTADFWKGDFESREWEWINGLFAGAVSPGAQTNHIVIDVTESNPGRVDISLGVNGRTPLVIFNQPAEAGWVGLTLFGHAMQVNFDNFVFRTEETPLYPEGLLQDPQARRLGGPIA